MPLLIQQGYNVRCMARDTRKLAGRWNSLVQSDGQLEIVYGDMLKSGTLPDALKDIDVAYFLVHAMGDGEKGFADRESKSAVDFATIAAEQGIKRIIYLGGLGRRDQDTSEHLESRHKTGDLLRSGSVPVTELRAAVIIGAGSASFEMLRHLTEKLPLMICPKWIETRTQPISISDVLVYLISALKTPETAGKVLDIGSPDILTYRQMMLAYAAAKGLDRIIIAAPVLTPRLSAYWVNLITPIPASIAFPLIEGLKTETICENNQAQQFMPIPLTSFVEAVAAAIRETDAMEIPTRWTGAHLGGLPLGFDPDSIAPKALRQNKQVLKTKASATSVRMALVRIGGSVGWYYANWLWVIRGALDRAIGGVGLRRGRRHPENIAIGDTIDFWRVEEVTPLVLRLRAEMKVPGSAWLEFRITENNEGGRDLVQTAYYVPNSFWGNLYWIALIPIHHFVFKGMARGIIRWAEDHSAQNKIGSSGAAPAVH